ncbi:hypothetical protein Cgig2_000261 [Carnegiea gigantea]|uniref:Uncharacterized protein n=1 Tax=Carnegiea gigantea TaxID=171969 RepID=A0A9Q1GR42_9CARY|nr:hypothetical protein Cgig2_000261 [Carnegiea gigantea]
MDSVPLPFVSGTSGTVVLRRVKNAGCEGTGRDIEELLSIRAMEDIVGLSAGLCWMHNKPMWIHLNISVLEAAEMHAALDLELYNVLDINAVTGMQMTAVIRSITEPTITGTMMTTARPWRPAADCRTQSRQVASGTSALQRAVASTLLGGCPAEKL